MYLQNGFVITHTKEITPIIIKATPYKVCAENMSADSVQSRQAGFVRCCLKEGEINGINKNKK